MNTDKLEIRISVDNTRSVYLRSAKREDMETLRIWKNDQRNFFFHNEIITSNQQMLWWESFAVRPDDYMFLVVVDERAIGCLGIRWKDKEWDVYNIILGEKAFSKQGLMGSAFYSMISFALQLKVAPVSLQVLSKNPAVEWYKKHGFVVKGKQSNFYSMVFEGFNSFLVSEI